MKSIILGFLVIGALACSPINKAPDTKPNTGKNAGDGNPINNHQQNSGGAGGTTGDGTAGGGTVATDGTGTGGVTTDDNNAEGKNAEGKNAGTALANGKTDKKTDEKVDAVASAAGKQKVRNKDRTVDNDTYSDTGPKKELEQKMIQDATLLSIIKDYEQKNKVDCIMPRMGQIHRAADCDDHCCDFKIDVSCLTRVDSAQKTDNSTGVRITLGGYLRYDLKTYDFLPVETSTETNFSLTPAQN